MLQFLKTILKEIFAMSCLFTGIYNNINLLEENVKSNILNKAVLVFNPVLFVLSLAALGLHCCKQAFSTCSSWASHCSESSLWSTGSRHTDFSTCGTWA